MAKQPESKLIKAARAYLEGRGAWVFKVHGGDNPFQEVGIPDLLVCYKGHFIGLEAKLPGQQLDPKQEAVIERMRKAGATADRFESITELQDILRQIPK